MQTLDIDAAALEAAEGDDSAFALVCHALQHDVWRYCMALTGDRELAHDAAQETFMRLVTAVRRYRGDGPFMVYTLVIARRATAAVLRREWRRPDHPAGDDLPDAPDATGDMTRFADAYALLDVLSEDLRQAFVLTQLVGLPYEDAAAVADCPVGTIRSRVHRARERLVAADGADQRAARAATAGAARPPRPGGRFHDR